MGRLTTKRQHPDLRDSFESLFFFFIGDNMDIIEFIKEIDSHYIIGIVGDLGDGKTIAGISITILLQMLQKSIGCPKEILTNIPLAVDYDFAEYYDDLDERHNTIMFLDELHQIADSRTSMKASNFFTSGITMDVRKFGNRFIWTSQERGQVEKRVRNRTTLHLHPRQIAPLIFDIALHNFIDSGYDKVILNLNAFKDLYDTRYKPIPLLIRDEDENDN